MSEKTIAQKLMIKEGQKVLFLDAPPGYEAALGALPAKVQVLTKPTAAVDVIQVLVTSKKELAGQLPGWKAALRPRGILWITYPKGTSKIKTDINRDTIREYAASVGLQAVAIFSVDDTWAALRLKVV